MAISNEVQQPETDPIVELFSIDLTRYGDSIYYFVMASTDPDPIVWDGNTYVPFDCVAQGFELNGNGQAPSPKISFSTTNSLVTGLINDFQDLIGAKVIRTKTFKKYLDGEPSANTSAHFPLDIYRVERKSKENRYFVEFELSSILDQQGQKLPAREISSFCPWLYRTYNGGTSGDPLLDFDYAPGDNACPYQGSDYFDIEGNTTTASGDKCSKLVGTGCKKRFGATAVLPHGGFISSSRPFY